MAVCSTKIKKYWNKVSINIENVCKRVIIQSQNHLISKIRWTHRFSKFQTEKMIKHILADSKLDSSF